MAQARREATAGVGGSVAVYFMRHAQVCVEALGRFARTPVASLLTAAVIGIALALPAGLHVLLRNAQGVISGWDAGTRISLYLKQDVALHAADALARQLRARRDVRELRLIPRDEALAEFRRHSGFGEALDALDGNPLPHVLVVAPDPALAPAQAEALVAEFRALPAVDIASHDTQWLRRLHALLDMTRRGVAALAVLLAVAVLLIVGNTIRLDIQNRRDEIEVSKLVGATDAFIRRPFLYGGMWYGLAGGLLAWLTVGATLWALDAPARRLASLYESGFALQGLGLADTALLLAAGVALGLAGSWTAVARHLRDIEPT